LVKVFQPRTVLELGTCIGISTAYISAAADAKYANRVFTLEDCEPLAALAKKNLNLLGLGKTSVLTGPLKNSLSSFLRKYAPLDIVFDDHVHTKNAVLKNFDQIYPFLSDNALYVFDDIALNEDMKSAWENLKLDKRINITISIALGTPYPNIPQMGKEVYPRIGLGIILKGSDRKYHLNVVVDSLDTNKDILFEKV
jgi:predicted O-methyltransferase YrrM